MKERPILFSGPMVRAILEGRKTQTRRIVKPQPVSNGHDFDAARGEIRCHCDYLPPDCLVQAPHYDHPFLDQPERMCPYGEPGDRLWVRETWGHGCRPDPFDGWRDGIEYRADEHYLVDDSDDLPLHVPTWPEGFDPDSIREGWRPSIHMPRWASRITLAVTSVRVERLQDITEEDAVAEGVQLSMAESARATFAALWNTLNEERAPYQSNPWVWVVGFEVAK